MLLTGWCGTHPWWGDSSTISPIPLINIVTLYLLHFCTSKAVAWQAHLVLPLWWCTQVQFYTSKAVAWQAHLVLPLWWCPQFAYLKWTTNYGDLILVVVLLGCCRTILLGASLCMWTLILPTDRLLAGNSLGPSELCPWLYWDANWSSTLQKLTPKAPC